MPRTENRTKAPRSEFTDSIENQTLPNVPGFENKSTSSHHLRTLHKSESSYHNDKEQSPSSAKFQDTNKLYTHGKAYSVPKFGHHGPFATRTMSYNVVENEPSLQVCKSNNQMDCFYNPACKKPSKCCSSSMDAKLGSVITN